MARVVVFGAAGQAGKLICAEALHRGHEVTGVVRDRARASALPDGVSVQPGDATSPASVAALAQGADAFVVAIGGADSSVWKRAAENLVAVLSKMPRPVPRIVHMGGGATLLTPEGTRFLDLPGFPPQFRAPAEGQAEALAVYRSIKDPKISWTYLSPPPEHFELGQRTGRYRTRLDRPVTDDRGHSAMSYQDFAVAIVDEIENGRFINMRFTVGY